MLNVADYPPGWLDAVLTPKKAAQECGVSEATLERHGPAKLHLSPRRTGYTRRDLLLWLDERREVATPIPCSLQGKVERPHGGQYKTALAAAALATSRQRRRAAAESDVTAIT